ncbi:ATP-binding protein [Halopseudomonas sp.]|uniref:hybrid sensor histidine kinase/response regulator n=1 Tax=Halopseudomonas sp. TaxID=2901191 RepID=UPI00311FBF15
MKNKGMYLLLIAVVVFSSTLLATVFWFWGGGVAQRHEQIDDEWVAAQDRYLQANDLLNEIVSRIGYGGFIHDFKNYVLRGDEQYVTHMYWELASSKQAISALRAGGYPEDSVYLDTVLATLLRYESHIDDVAQMRARGEAIGDVDRAVRVDDTAAVGALKALQTNNRNRLMQQRLVIAQAISTLQADIQRGLLLLAPMVLLNIAFVLALVMMGRQAKRLHDNQRETDLLQDTTPEAVLSINPAGVVTRANVAARELFGYGEELVGMAVEQLMPADYRAQHQRLRDMFSANPQRRQMGRERKVEILKKNGVRREVNISLGGYNRSDGELVIVACMHDVQEQNEQRRALQHYQQSVRLASEVASLGVWELDVEREMVTLDEWSQRLLSLSLTGEEVSLAHFLDCFCDADKALLQTSIVECQHGHALDQSLWSCEETTQRRFVRVVGQCTQEGLALRIVGVLYDITAYENAKLQLEHSLQQVERANTAKSEFLANMSHEIRTPMNAILGTLNLLEDMPLSDRQGKLVGSARASAESLLQILNDILDLSKLEVGKMVLQNEEFSLDEMLHRSLDLFSVVAAEKCLQLNVEVEPQAHMHLIGDSLRLTQIINNLLSNAIKFTESGGVKLKVELLSTNDNSTELRFIVSDSGIGMTEEQQQLVLQPFTQADMGTTRRYGGSGLGLPICVSLLYLMNSRLEVSSEPGRGSSFSFDLKLGHSAGARRYADLSLTPQDMLLVSDDLELQGLIGQYLLNWGVQLKTLEFGGESAALLGGLEGGEYTLLLVDMTTPDHVEGTIRCCQQWMVHNARDDILVLDRFGMSADTRFSDISPTFVPYPMTPSRLFDCLSLRRKHSLAMGASLVDSARRIAAHLRGIRLLLAEDVYSNQIIALDFLQQLGIHADVAENGMQAVDMVKKNSYDAVLMDFHMPLMDGLEATRLIREHFTRDQLPVIAMTAAAFERDKRLAEDAGMNTHVSKPINFVELATALATHVHVRFPAEPAQALPVPDSQVHDSLPEFGSLAAHLDLGEVANHFGHNPALYVECIKSFVQDFGGWPTAVEAELNAGDGASASKTAHKLKGAASSIYANQLASLAKKLQLELEQGESPSLPTLQNRLEQFMKDAQAFLQRHETFQQIAPEEGVERFRERLQRLSQQLQQHMFVPQEQLDTLLHTAPGGLDRLLVHDLQRAITNFRFTEASELVTRILASLSAADE